MSHLNTVTDIGLNVKKERKSKKLSIEKLSKISGVSGITISNIENKKSNPTVSILWKLAEALEIPLTKLFSKNSVSSVKVSRLNNSSFVTNYKHNWRVESIFSQENIEVYRVKMSQKSSYSVEKHHQNSLEILTVMSGKIKLILDGKEFEVNKFETISFPASQQHTYVNDCSSDIYLNIIVKYNYL
ncbi:helix-turn-helix transcriptional regulator [Enterococcus faecalis]|nr:helix-turn-helix transcriptional regulator [Enterococcus faecalis]NSN50590.1 helix-turn-helix transcriptional regulator [Enterococcus faecalis]